MTDEKSKRATLYVPQHCKHLGRGLHVLGVQRMHNRHLFGGLDLLKSQEKSSAHKTKVCVQQECGSDAVTGCIN